MAGHEKRRKYSIIKWTAPKGFAAMLLFLALCLLLEYLVTYSFLSSGLTDEYAWIETFRIPYGNWSFTLVVSPLVHLLPLTVVVVLMSSWVFTTKHLALVPHRKETPRKTTVERRRTKGRRFKSARKFTRRIDRSTRRAGRALKKAILRIPGFSIFSRRLVFARTAVRSASVILMTFVSFALLAYLLAYPWWIHDAMITFYRGNPLFLAFVIGAQESLRSLSNMLTPIQTIATAINDSLLGGAPSFRSSLTSLGVYAEPLVKLDITGKYLLVQNLAAWVCASIALVYGNYAKTRRYKKR
ncbi:hypothetical protein GWN65_02175 [Candidatus Bathyarchaeota archaeon]|nr:hypothetical protein [Candidatus Bathyarchaeota archaeon]NIV43805.1 hypothetical protein [Candidatus Bathyarchaeota archaeon]